MSTAVRTVAHRGPTLVPSWVIGYALGSPLLAETGDERTLPLALKNGFHEKANFVKPTGQLCPSSKNLDDFCALDACFHSHSRGSVS